MYHKIKEGEDHVTLWERRDPVRVGIVGYGLGGSTFHAPLVAATPGLELVAIATSNPERVAKAKQHGRLAIPFQNRRWDNEILTVQKLIADGTLGEIQRYESRYERWRPNPKARWMEPGADERGEGVLGDLTVHLVDQALLLFGPARRVYAEFERRHPDIVVVDDVFIAITHKNGVISHLFTSPNVGILGPRLTVLGS